MNEGDKIQLKNQEVEVVKCDECDALMVNIDANQLAPGDLTILKSKGVRVSNPDTEDQICLNCEHKPSFGAKLNNWFSTPSSSSDDDDDDSSFFSSGSFGGGSSFGGFGGGSFGGGGASASF